MQVKSITLYQFSQFGGSHCGYCDTYNSRQAGFSTPCLTTETYQQMMDRGWRRCGTYYYCFDPKNNCCCVYTIRLNVQNFLYNRKQHRKASKKFMQLLENPLLQGTQVPLRKILEEFEYKRKEKPIKTEQPKASQNTQLLQQQPKQINMQQELSSETEQQIKTSLARLLKRIESSLIGYASSLEDYFKSNGIDDINLVVEIIQSQIQASQIVTQTKIFISNGKQKGDYYCNFLQLFYGLSKKTLFQKLNLDQYVLKVSQYLQPLLDVEEDLIFAIDKSGYISIIKKGDEQKRAILQKQLEKQSLKQNDKKIDKEIGKIEQLKLIKEETFMPNKFQVGCMQIILKKAGPDKEAWELYQRYCKQIHGKNEKNENSYINFLGQQGLESGLLKSEVDKKTLLFLGCYHMCYYLQQKLVAVGVVDITKSVLSSVYFFYDPLFEEKFKFGTFAALIEIQYVQLMNRYFPDFLYYYMGFYIQSTNKMVYKGEFEPSELLCPITYTWVPLDTITRKEIDEKMKAKPNARVHRLSKPNVGVIADMDYDKIDKNSVYEKVTLVLKTQQMKLKDLNPQGQFFVQNLIQFGLKVMGQKLISETPLRVQ